MLLPTERENAELEKSDHLSAWDCHVHVFGPHERYPTVPERRYRPGLAETPDLLAHADAVGVNHLVLIQPTPYGTDNRCLLDAVRTIGPSARAVVVLKPEDIDDNRLASLHARGVRGVRINAPGGIRILEKAHDAIDRIAAGLAGTSWHIEVNCAPALAGPIADQCAAAGVPVVFAHLLGLDPSNAEFDVRSAEVMALAKGEPIWIKLSGADRVCRTPYEGARWAEVAVALVNTAPDRIVWGSDWPHTPLDDGDGESFRTVDDRGQLTWAKALLTETTSRLVMCGNPARLYA